MRVRRKALLLAAGLALLFPTLLLLSRALMVDKSQLNDDTEHNRATFLSSSFKSNSSDFTARGTAHPPTMQNHQSAEVVGEAPVLLQGQPQFKGEEGKDKRVPGFVGDKAASHRAGATPTPVPVVTVDHQNVKRRLKIKEMIKHAWSGYVQYAMGGNQLMPVSRKSNPKSMFSSKPIGATLIDSLDTLYIAGLTEEFTIARDWVGNHFNISIVPTGLSVFEVTIRFIGGLLSAYMLTKDPIFKTKALDVAQKLNPAFDTPLGIPKALVNIQTGETENWKWLPGGCSILSEIGTLHLEYQYLSYVSKNPSYLEKMLRLRRALKKAHKSDGLYYTLINPSDGHWCNKVVSLGALGDSFYEYLLKAWLITNKKDTEARDMFYEAIDTLERKLFRFVSDKKFLVISDLMRDILDNKMQHLACFSGGMFALASIHATNGKSQHYMDIAKNITRTCHESYIKTATKLGPNIFVINPSGEVGNYEPKYILRPETVESYFYLWRLTHDPMYRDWGWELVEALEEHCKVSTGGYSGVQNVFNGASPKDDEQQTFFIAETLKYLYLLFSEDEEISLDKYVFNTEGHPLPVII